MPATVERRADRSISGAEAPQTRARLVKTACLWALVIFASINAFLWLVAGEDKKASNDLWSGSGSIDLALADLKRLDRRPDVVLLGSSLMMYPFWAMDKERNAGIPDIFHHHFSNTLEDALGGHSGRKPVVFSMAIFGQMISDAYIYVDEFLKGDRQPKYLVFGIAPRDFSDYDLPAPMATMTFKRLIGLNNFSRYADLYLPGWQDKADFIAAHACFFYGRRWRLQHEVDRALAKAYAAIGIGGGAKPAAAGEAQAGFMLAGSADERWANSLNEYRRRYRNIGERDLSVQTGFLRRLLSTCRERGIKVVLINMPLTDVNRQLFPSGFYESFKKALREATAQPGVTLLDLGDSPDFQHADFWDTTHLNHAGGHKLVERLLPVLRAQ